MPCDTSMHSMSCPVFVNDVGFWFFGLQNAVQVLQRHPDEYVPMAHFCPGRAQGRPWAGELPKLRPRTQAVIRAVNQILYHLMCGLL